MKIVMVMEHLQEEDHMCYELFRELLSSAEYAAYSIVLCVRQISKTVQTRYEGMSAITVVSYDSKELADALAGAAIIISNTMLPEYYLRREGQSYVDVPGENQERIVSQLLNATCLLSKGAEYTKRVYEQKYHLRGLYQGVILEHGHEPVKSYAYQVLHFVLYQEEAQCQKRWEEEERQKLLFVLNVEKETPLSWNRYQALLNQLADWDYAITLLVPGPETMLVRERMCGLRESIHRICKRGAVNYEDSSYEQLQKMREEFLQKDEIEEVMALRPTEAFIWEWRRLLGESYFSYAYLVSPQSVFWYGMFLELASEHTLLIRDTVPKQANGYRISMYFDRVVAMNLSVYQAFLKSGEVEERKIELFDPQYCLPRSNARFLSVDISGREYLECGVWTSGIGMKQGLYVKAPALSRYSIFLSAAGLTKQQQEAVIDGCYDYIKEEQEAEVYIEVANLPVSSEEERITYVVQEAVSVELLQRLDAILSITTEEDYKYSYIAALIKKPYGNARLNETAYERCKEQAKELLRSRGAYRDGRTEGIYVQLQQQEMRKLLY